MGNIHGWILREGECMNICGMKRKSTWIYLADMDLADFRGKICDLLIPWKRYEVTSKFGNATKCTNTAHVAMYTQNRASSFPSPVQTRIRQTPFIGFSYSFCSVLNSSRGILSPQENLCETFDHSWKAFKPNYWDHIWMDFEAQSTMGTYSKICFENLMPWFGLVPFYELILVSF